MVCCTGGLSSGATWSPHDHEGAGGVEADVDGDRDAVWLRRAGACRARKPAASSASTRAWGEHDHGDADQADGCAHEVVAVGTKPVGDNTPQQRPGDEHSPVRSEDPTEVRIGLEGGDEAVPGKSNHPSADPADPAMLAHPLPHQPCPTDLEHRSKKEQDNRADSVRHCTDRTAPITKDLDIAPDFKVYGGTHEF